MARFNMMVVMMIIKYDADDDEKDSDHDHHHSGELNPRIHTEW